MRILAIDGGLAAAGFAVVDTTGGIRVTHAEVFRSSPASKAKRKKTGLHVAVDRVSRARTLSRRIADLVLRWKPDVVAAEEINHMRGITANVSAGLFWGSLVAVCEVYGKELQSVRVQEWRAFARSGLAASDATEMGIHLALGDIPGALHTVTAIEPRSAREHALDAIGVGWWAAHHVSR